MISHVKELEATSFGFNLPKMGLLTGQAQVHEEIRDLL